jgi:hypothetical protein
MLLHALDHHDVPSLELQNYLEQTQLFSKKTVQVRFQSCILLNIEVMMKSLSPVHF